MNKPDYKYYSDTKQGGFTIVEVVVTLVILSLFLTGFFQAFLVLESQRVNVARQARASDLAYSNLRKFTTRPSGLVCTSDMDLTTGSAATKPGVDVSTYGFTYDASELSTLGTNASQSVKIFAPAGCNDFTNSPIKVVSTVTYGINGDPVSHATFVQ